MASAVIHSFFSSPCLKLSVESEKSYGKHLSLYNALKVAAQSPGGVAQLEPTLVPLKLYLDSMSHAGIRASSPPQPHMQRYSADEGLAWSAARSGLRTLTSDSVCTT